MCTGPEAGCRAQGRALDALCASKVGCTARHPRGMRVTAPTGDAQNSTHAGCTEWHPRGLHVTATTREAQNGTHAGCTSLTRGRLHITAPTRGAHHGTHTPPTPQHRGGMHGAGCGMPVVAPSAGVGSAGSSGHTDKAPRASALPRRAAAALGAWGGGHMMGSDVGAPRVSHATACCHPHGHCGQTPGTLGTAGCCW